MKFLIYISIILTLGMSCRDDQREQELKWEKERLAGGQNFTTFVGGENAFGIQGNALEKSESRNFVVGNSLFRSNWVIAPSSVKSLDGLGPLFNATSCGSCHFKDGRGQPPTPENPNAKGLLHRIADMSSQPNAAPIPHPIYGAQFQDFGILKAKKEGEVQIEYSYIDGYFSDGTPYQLQRPIYQFRELNYGALGSVHSSPRIASQLIGLGLLESISEADILKHEDINDVDNDGISGKANMVYDEVKQKKTLGRFGWKANQPSIIQQNAGAFNGDMGLTSSIFPKDDWTETQESAFPNLPHGGDPEVSDEDLAKITVYVQALSVPARRNVGEPAYERGKLLFQELQCNSCHIEHFTTGIGNNIRSLDSQRITPFTDLLLHDMGEGLADDMHDFLANGREWRTAPLWGIGLINGINGHTRLLHDGRARDVNEAILWHGGEAQAAQSKYLKLSKTERNDLIYFINSL